MKKLGLVLLAISLITGLSASQAFAWAITHHPAISLAMGASLEAPHSATPDTWGENHLSRYTLAEKARYWAKKAHDTAWWDLVNKPIRAGYALHYMEDCGQPWHAMGVGGNDHLAYEVFANASSFTLSVSAGGASPIKSTSADDVRTKAYALMNYVDGYYQYIDTPAEWVINTWVTNHCLYKVGQYAKGMTSYIY